MNDLFSLGLHMYRMGYIGNGMIDPVYVDNVEFFNDWKTKLDRFTNFLLNEKGCSKNKIKSDLDFIQGVKTLTSKVNYSYPNNNFIAFSGGIDSLVSYLIMKEDRSPTMPMLYFWNHEQDQIKHELKSLEHFEKRLGIDVLKFNVNPDSLGCSKETNFGWKLGDFKIPARNFVLVSFPTMFINHDCNIGLGAYKGEIMNKNRDKSKRFFKFCSELFSDYFNKEIKVYSPVGKMAKSEEIDYLYNHGIDIGETRTCITGNKDPCGKCKPCFNLWVAIENSNFSDGFGITNLYRRRIKRSKILDYYKKNLNNYPLERRKEISKAINSLRRK